MQILCAFAYYHTHTETDTQKTHLQNNFYSLKKGFDGICYICMCEVWMDGSMNG